MAKFVLSDNDRKRIVKMVGTLRRRRKNSPDWNTDKPHEMSPEVYVTKGSVPAAAEDPPGSGKIIAGKNVLPIYKLRNSDNQIIPVELPNGKQKRLEVFNVRCDEVGKSGPATIVKILPDGSSILVVGFREADFTLIKRDKFGKWHIDYDCPKEVSTLPASSSSSSSSVGIGSPGSSSSRKASCISTGGGGFSGVFYADEEDANGENIFNNIFIWIGNTICIRLNTTVDEVNQPGVFRVKKRCFQITGVAYTSPFSITVNELCPWQIRDFVADGGKFDLPPPTSISSSSSSSSSA